MKILVLLALVGLSAQAGTVLKFQNQTIDPLGVQSLDLDQKFSQSSKDQVIQFFSPITEADKAEARALGIQIFRYLPDDALIVRANHAQIARLSANGKVRAAMPFSGGFKVDPNLPALSVFSLGKTQNILISAFTGADAQNILRELQNRDSDLRVLEQSGRSLAVQMDPIFISDLTQMLGVEYVQALEKMELMQAQLLDDSLTNASPENHPLDGFESGTKIMGFESIWAQGYSGQGQIVGVSDTGLDIGILQGIHGDFAGGIHSGYSYGIGAKGWEDSMGHGTHVAGSVAGRGAMIAGLKGGAYSAQLIPQGMWSPIIENLTVPPKLEKMFQAAYQDGARIHTNSWGAARNPGAYDAMAQQVDEFMWANPDFLILFAAGNSGVDDNKDGLIDPNSVGSPATAKNTLSVGASENLNSVGGIQKMAKELNGGAEKWGVEPLASSRLSDNANGVALFSSRGPTKDGRTKPEIVAPGTNILSARSHVVDANPMWGAYNADYTYAGGTSMATPLTAGAAAVTRQILIEKFKIANPSAALVKATMMHTAFDMYPGQYGLGATQELKARPNSDEGYGRVDMKALAEMSVATALIEGAVVQDASFEKTVRVQNGKLLVNLVYTDAPGTPAAGAALVNDIDLSVTGPDGQVYGTADRINNNELVELNGLAAGDYKISIKGTKVPMGKDGKQPFALVYTAL